MPLALIRKIVEIITLFKIYAPILFSCFCFKIIRKIIGFERIIV